MEQTTPTRSTIPCYAADGMSLGYRSLDAAQRLVSRGYVRPAYGRKGHLRAIWLLPDDWQQPRPVRAHPTAPDTATSSRWRPGDVGNFGALSDPEARLRTARP